MKHLETHRILILFSYLTIGMAFLITLVVFFWLLYPYEPATFNHLPHKVTPKVVEGGKFMTVEVDVCKHMPIAPTITRVFVDGVIYQIPVYTTVNDVVGCGIRKVQIYIPKGLPTGEYYINTSYSFQVNPIRKVELSTVSEKFEVVE